MMKRSTQIHGLFVIAIAIIATLTFLSCNSVPQNASTSVPQKANTSLSILELTVLDGPTAKLWALQENIQPGSKQFADREFSIKEIPEIYAGASYIHTAADSKKFIGPILASFKVSQDADVYIAHDTRVVIKPDWLKAWEATSDVIINTEPNPTSFGIFKKSFPKGSVVELGGNGQSGGALMYMVLIAPKGFKGAISQTAKQAASDPSTRKAIWPSCLGETDEWFQTPEAIRVGDNLIAYQRVTGAWSKNVDMAIQLTPSMLANLAKEKSLTNDSTIDNNATTTQIRYLARVYTITKIERFKEAALKGLSYLLEAQYDNGGWPQFYPLETSNYSHYITFNDDAMTNVLRMLTLVLNDPSFAFIDSTTKTKTKNAVEKGIEVILASQVVVNGKKTVWCAQHYPDTLLPAPARAYELPSLSGQESVGVLRYLMSIENPSQKVVDAIQAGIAWLDSARIDNIAVIEKTDPSLKGGRDKIVISSPGAPPVWARFYDLDTEKAFFVDRSGIKKQTLAEIDHERRTGYNYYTNAPLMLIVKDYPTWQSKWAPTKNVVKTKYL
jgi:PelA/Pel-15E family pectate lyase